MLSVTAGPGSATLSTTTGVTGTVTNWNYNYKKSTDTNYPDHWKEVKPPQNTTSLSSFKVIGLTGGTTYNFKVRAVNGDDLGSESAKVDVTPTAATAPTQPTLVATAGHGSVTLNATGVDNSGSAITKWQYQYSPTDESSYSGWQDVPKPGTTTTAATVSFKVTGLTASTLYYFKVRAVNRVGDGTASAAASATPTSAAPPKPKVTAGAGNDSVVLWASAGSDNGSAITEWQYQYKTTGTYGSWEDVPAADVSSTKLFMDTTVSGLTDGTAYTFKVRAVNGSGNGTESDEVKATPEANAPGAPDTDLRGSVIPLIDGPANVTLTWAGSSLQAEWSPVEGSWGYEVHCSDDFKVSWVRCATDVAGSPATISTGIANNKVYAVRVRADTPYGESGWGESALLFNSNSAPVAPIFSSISRSDSTKQITVSWTHPNSPGTTYPGGTTYKLEYAKSPNLDPSNGTHWTNVPITWTVHTINFTDSDFASSSYMVRVRAGKTSPSRNSLWTYSALIGPTTSKPDAPEYLNVTRSDDGTSLTVTWSTSLHAQAYEVQTSADYQANWTKYGSNTNIANRTVSGLDAAKDYYVRVKGTNSIVTGDDKWSTSSLFRATPTPAAPSSATLTRRLDATQRLVMDLEWPAVDGAVVYEVKCGYIYYYTMSTCVDDVTSTSTTISSIKSGGRWRSLTPSRYHFVAVRAKNSSGVGPWTPAFSFPGFPGDITNLSSSRSGTTITLTWTVPDDYDAPIAAYDVLCKAAGATKWSTCTGSPFPPGSHTTGSTYTAAVTGTDATKAYDILARARSGGGTASLWAKITVPV